MKNRIKKVLLATLATLTVIGNITSAPVNATEYTEVVKAAPMVKVIDCNDLTEEMLTTRAEHNIMYIERIYGIVTDNKKNGKVLNTPVDGGYYISYASVKGARKGDVIVTYCIYNPYTNWDDDVIERWDFIQQEVESMIVNIFSNGTNIHITDTGNAYNVSIPDQKSFSDMSVRRSELNKVIYGILDSLETKGSKPLEVYRKQNR